MSKEVGEYLDELVRDRGEPDSWQTANLLVSTALFRLGVDRQRQYGPGNMAKFGLHGVVVRATDKLERLFTMVWSGKNDARESVEDTAGDLANYGLYGVMISRGWWTLPMEPGEREDPGASA